MKSTTVALAFLCIFSLLYACTSPSKSVSRKYFGEGGSSQDTLYIRARETPVYFILQKNRGGEGGSSQDTLYLQANETGRLYKGSDDDKRKKKP
jgi:hypothetical protein